MKKKDSKQPGMELPPERQDPYLEQELPGADKKPPGPDIPGKDDPGEKKKKEENNSEDREPVDERSEDL